MYSHFSEESKPRIQQDPIQSEAEVRAANTAIQILERVKSEYSRLFEDKKRQAESAVPPVLELEPMDPSKRDFGLSVFRGVLDSLKAIEQRRIVVQVPEAQEHLRLLSTCCNSLSVDLDAAIYSKDWIWDLSEQEDSIQPGALRAWKTLQDLLSRISICLDGLIRAGNGKTGMCGGGTGDLAKRHTEEIKLLAARLHYSKDLYADMLSLRSINVPRIKPINLRPTVLSVKLPEKDVQVLCGEISHRLKEEMQTFAQNCEKLYRTRLANIQDSQHKSNLKPIVMEDKVKDHSGEKDVDFINSLRYFYGDGYAKSPIKALTMLRDLAPKNPAAALFLGEQYIKGEYVPQDFDVAEKWIKLAYERRFSRKPAYWMGYLLERKLQAQDFRDGLSGVSVAPVLNYYAEATENLEGVAEPPLQEAFYRMGLIHERLGLKPQAKVYFEQGTTDLNCLNSLGQLLVDEASLSTLTGAAGPDPAKLRRASELFRASAGGGNTKAMCNLANLLLHGKGVEKSIQEAKLWYNKAVTKQEPEAFYHLGLIAHQEAVLDNSPTRYLEANNKYRLALSLNPNHSQANYYLGCLLEGGFGGAKDLVLAANHFQRALDSDTSNHKAMYKLGKIYMAGVGVKEADQFKGFRLVQESANMGNKEAREYMASLQTGLPAGRIADMQTRGFQSGMSLGGGHIPAFDDSKKLAQMHKLNMELDLQPFQPKSWGRGGFMES